MGLFCDDIQFATLPFRVLVAVRAFNFTSATVLSGRLFVVLFAHDLVLDQLVIHEFIVRILISVIDVFNIAWSLLEYFWWLVGWKNIVTARRLEGAHWRDVLDLAVEKVEVLFFLLFLRLTTLICFRFFQSLCLNLVQIFETSDIVLHCIFTAKSSSSVF